MSKNALLDHLVTHHGGILAGDKNTLWYLNYHIQYHDKKYMPNIGLGFPPPKGLWGFDRGLVRDCVPHNHGVKYWSYP